MRQGVTTEVVGMCGFSPAPDRARAARIWCATGRAASAASCPSPGTPSASTSTTCAALGPSVNIVQFVGHGALRLAAVGGGGARR